ncbi:hypothetical protein FQZ97_961570 [compost metagenome]
MQPRPDAVPAEQHHAQEARFQEEGGQHLIGQQRSGDAARKLREARPVGAELIGHDQAGNDPHAEVQREDLDPELVQGPVHRVLGVEPACFQERQETCQPDRDGGK